MPAHNPPSRSKTVTHSDTRKVPRRAALGSIGTVGLASLAGCLSVFGADPVNAEQNTTDEDETETGGEQTPARTPTATTQPDTSERTPESISDSDPDVDGPKGLPKGPGVMPGDLSPSRVRFHHRFNPLNRAYVGPITSPPTNEWNPYYDDPEPGKALADVTVHNSTIEDWVVSPPGTNYRMDSLELTVDDNRVFTATGGLHYRDKCGFFGVNHLYVRGSTATISLGYSHDPSCSESKIRDGAGFWYGPILLAGTLNGDFDTLRIALLNGNTNFDGSTSDHTLEFEV